MTREQAELVLAYVKKLGVEARIVPSRVPFPWRRRVGLYYVVITEVWPG